MPHEPRSLGPDRPLVTIVVPTLNEAGNIALLVRRISRALRGLSHEIIIADDASTDGTAEVARELAVRYPSLRVMQRRSDFGLSAAVLEGFRQARGSLLGVIDADLQHDPAVLPRLIASLADADIAIGSRYAFRGATCGWSFARETQSRFAASITRTVLGLRIHDPLSGFFVLRREVFESVRDRVDTAGWKLLLEILVAAPEATAIEVPYTFRARCRGTTKMHWRVVAAWAKSLPRLRRVVAAQRRLEAANPLLGAAP